MCTASDRPTPLTQGLTQGLTQRLAQALALQRSGQDAEAEALYRQVLVQWPGQPEALHRLGLIWLERQDPAQAAAWIRAALSQAPQVASAHVHLGMALQAQGQLELAIDSYAQALKLNPRLALAHYNRAVARQALGQDDAARQGYQEALQHEPACVPALINLGLLHWKAGQAQAAEQSFRQALLQQPGHAESHFNLGNVLRARQRYDEALACYDAALLSEPQHGGAALNRGVALNDLRRHEEALEQFDQTLALDPPSAALRLNRSVALNALGRHEAALTDLRHALQLEPGLAEAHHNLGQSLLRLERLSEGWEHYEWRWTSPQFPSVRRDAGLPAWQPGDGSRQVLVWGEQGVGDEIMFGSLLPEFSRRQPGLEVRLDARLLPLFRRSMPGIRFEASTAAIATTGLDSQVPLASLAQHLRKEMAHFGAAPAAFLQADPSRSQAIAQALTTRPALRCGLAWKTANLLAAPERNLGVDELCALIRPHPEVQWINLQYGQVASDLEPLRSLSGISVHQHPGLDLFHDLEGLAALIANCDLVISADNLTVHLAAALGKPVWTLLPLQADWRWFLHRSDSPWYPRMRLYRQRHAGQWGSVVQAVQADLARLMEAATTAGTGPQPR